MILDAAAGNRTMWRVKDAPSIIYIDIEKRLERKPTIYADNTNTPFLPESFDSIFYDPPHGWGSNPIYAAFPDKKTAKKYWRKDNAPPTYYGHEKFKTRASLISHIYKAEKEFRRILKDNGLLWLKWNEMDIPLNRILPLFAGWYILLMLPLVDIAQKHGRHQTYWVCLCKKNGSAKQTRLT